MYLIIIVISLLSSEITLASDSLYLQQCSSCHGKEGQGSKVLKAPVISGQDKEYLIRQLTNFKQGLRGNKAEDASGLMMAGIAKMLSLEDIDALANYLSDQPFISAKPSKDKGGFIGRGLYRNCQSCHGAFAQGEVLLKAPRLAGQHTWYLKSQLQKYKLGLRGQHADDKYGKQMYIVAQDLNFEVQLESILAYISHLKPKIETKSVSH